MIIFNFYEQASRVDENGRFFDIKTNASSEPIRMRVSKVTRVRSLV